MAAPRFVFPPETIEFLADLGEHNRKAWFDANRGRYEAAFLEPAKAFVEAIGPDLDAIVPGIAVEPRVNGSIFRINRDVRFSKDKTPYKDHLDLWFWEGERRTAVSGLYLRIAPTGVTVGTGSHGFDRARLAAYRAAVADELTGTALLATVLQIEDQGHEVGGETYARTPLGYDVDEDRARLLRHSALHVHAELPAGLATEPGFTGSLLRLWRQFAPLHAWLTRHVQEQAAPTG